MTLDGVQKLLTDCKPDGAAFAIIEASLKRFINYGPQQSYECCSIGLKEELTPKEMFQYYIICSPTALCRDPQDYHFLKNLLYELGLRNNRLAYRIV